ncbi:50S ribosomal protein L37ae [Candidatus Micrarchaeota archaeon]|nr:50S ribosomal protein L37ae [Candidatus Micrarchaeota archaeon]
MRTARYGAKLRNLYTAASTAKRSKYVCPKCSKTKVKRTGNSLWKCKSCGARIAGGAYALTTETGNVARRILEDSKS